MASVLALLVAISLLVFLWAGQRRLLYLPSGEVSPPGSVGLSSADAVTFQTSDGIVLAGWFVHPSSGPPRATVVVFNGNAGNRSYRAPLADGLSGRGLSVLLVDYRGYGGNAGHPSEDGLLKDARAALAYVVSRPDVDPRRLVYFGESLGTGVAVALALERPPAALVLRSPFTSLADVAAHHYWFLPARRLLWDRYDSLSRIGGVTAPLVVIAGTADRVVPFALSERLYAAVRGHKSLLVLPGSDHNDAELVAGPKVIEAVVQIVEESLEGKGRGAEAQT